jgi:acyl carrier protein
LDFDVFVTRLSLHLRVDFPDGAGRDTSLYEDLGLDSLQAFELLIIIEGLAEAMVAPLDIPALYTLGDAFAYYEDLRQEVLSEL